MLDGHGVGRILRVIGQLDSRFARIWTDFLQLGGEEVQTWSTLVRG